MDSGIRGNIMNFYSPPYTQNSYDQRGARRDSDGNQSPTTIRANSIPPGLVPDDSPTTTTSPTDCSTTGANHFPTTTGANHFPTTTRWSTTAPHPCQPLLHHWCQPLLDHHYMHQVVEPPAGGDAGG